MPSNESQIQKQIVEYLEWQKWPVYRMNSGTFQDARSGAWIKGQTQGTADLCVGYRLRTDGLWLLAWIEVKDKSYLSVPQISFLRKMNTLGCPWLVAHSVDDVIKWQENRGYHGSPKDVDDVLNDAKRYVPEVIKRKNAKASMADVNAFMSWDEKHR